MVLYVADGPTSADWLEAWATVAGAVLSAGAVLVAVLVVRQEQRHRREDKQDLLAQQARQVFARTTEAFGSKAAGYKGATVTVYNNSDRHISDVAVGIEDADRHQSSLKEIGDLAGHTSVEVGVRFADPSSVRWPFTRNPPPQYELKKFAQTTLHYTDSTGLSWSRQGRNEPARLRITLHLYGVFRLFLNYLYVDRLFSRPAQLFKQGHAAMRQYLNKKLEARWRAEHPEDFE